MLMKFILLWLGMQLRKSAFKVWWASQLSEFERRGNTCSASLCSPPHSGCIVPCMPHIIRFYVYYHSKSASSLVPANWTCKLSGKGTLSVPRSPGTPDEIFRCAILVQFVQGDSNSPVWQQGESGVIDKKLLLFILPIQNCKNIFLTLQPASRVVKL